MKIPSIGDVFFVVMMAYACACVTHTTMWLVEALLP